MAEKVFHKCTTASGSNPDDINYKITFDYEYIEDMYASWGPDDASDAKSMSDSEYFVCVCYETAWKFQLKGLSSLLVMFLCMSLFHDSGLSKTLLYLLSRMVHSLPLFSNYKRHKNEGLIKNLFHFFFYKMILIPIRKHLSNLFWFLKDEGCHVMK